MTVMKIEKRGTVALLTMVNGENRHNLEFATALLSSLDEIEADESYSSLILTSNDEKNWSLGIDLPWMSAKYEARDKASVREFLEKMDEVFKRMLGFPIPVIGAINGHAFGNGAILACGCDFLFMRSDRGFFCLPEVDLGLDFIPGLFDLVSTKLPRPLFTDLLLTGRRATAPELVESGVVKKACSSLDELTSDVFTFAESLQKQRTIFEKHKTRLNGPTISVFENESGPYYDLMMK